METPKISVLIPAYNAEKYITEAVESILDQSFKDFELIIIDDCSKDGTWKIIQELTLKDNRIKAIKNEKNLGISGTRNKLISLSKAKYIAWQDADDISLPYRLEKQYNYMEINTDVGICGGYLAYFEANKELGIRKYPTTDQELRKLIFRQSPVAQPSAIIRMECFDSVGLFPMASPVAEDLAMSFQIGTKYKFANLPEVLIRYRQVGDGATFSKLRIMEAYTLFLRLRYATTNPSEYPMSLFDKLYNFMQYAAIFIIPTRLKISLFNLIRNS